MISACLEEENIWEILSYRKNCLADIALHFRFISDFFIYEILNYFHRLEMPRFCPLINSFQIPIYIYFKLVNYFLYYWSLDSSKVRLLKFHFYLLKKCIRDGCGAYFIYSFTIFITLEPQVVPSDYIF